MCARNVEPPDDRTPDSSPDRLVAERDVVWMRGIRNGDPQAHDALVRAYGAALIRFAAHTLGSVDRAQDVVQDVLLRLWHDRATLTVDRDVAAYLFWRTRNRALDTLHSDRSAAQREGVWAIEQLINGPAALNSGVGTAEATELRAQVWRALTAVPPRCREIFMLVWDERLSHAEVAQVLGISVATVRNQMSRAMKCIVETLRPDLLEP